MDLKFYLRLFLRRLPYFLIFVALGSAAGLTVAVMLPPVYTARAVLVVESERIPGELASSTVQAEATEVLSIIRQRILTRARLLELANDFEIYGPPGGTERQSITPDSVVRDLRERIQIVTTGGAQRRGPTQATLVTVSFRADVPQMSAAVANEVVTAILEQNAELRRSVAGETLEFFEDEVARLDRELATRNAEMLAFREANLDALPDSLEFRRSQQAAAQERLVQLGREETILRDRRNRLVDLYESTGEIAALPTEIQSATEAELAELQRRLTLAESTLGEQNPRLRVLRTQVTTLEEIVAQERAERAGTAGVDPGLSAYEIQLADLDGQLSFIADQRAQIEAELAALQSTIEATPGNAVMIDTMERDYAAVRAQYEAAIANRARAETGEMIENLSKGQRISVIEPAVAPANPESPNRRLIAIAGFGAGVAVGLGLIVLLELLNTAIRRPADLQNKLGIQPFGTLPLIRTPGQIRRRRAAIAMAFMAVAIGVPAGLWYVETEVMPLDLLLDETLDRLGVAGLALDRNNPSPV